jgi:4-amino-4-deoxy-L-arabinose transferase-like glycosyltransferase
VNVELASIRADVTARDTGVATPSLVRPAARRVLALNVETAVWGMVLAVAAALRLVGLGGVPPTTAEALRARAAWDFAHGAATAAWPADLTSALTALIIRFGGDGIGWVRLTSALFGLAAVAALWLFRPYAGRAAALLAAALLAISPLAVAVSRTLNPDSAALLAGLLGVWLVLRLSTAGSPRLLFPLGAVAGVTLTTGAPAVAIALVLVAWLVLEIAWLDNRALADHWREALRDRTHVLAALLLAAPGLILGLIRFGAGPSRLYLAALADWSAPPQDAAAGLPWHAPLAVLLAYEPLALALGVAGLALIMARWVRVGAGGVSAYERLLVVWSGGGLLLALAALHNRPGQMLLVALPLMLCAAAATVHWLPALANLRPRQSGVALLGAGVLAGFLALKLLAWAQSGALSSRDVQGMLAALLVAAMLVLWALRESIPAAPGLLVAAAWLVLGALTLHSAAAVAFRDGDEMIFGQRTLPQRTVLAGTIDAALAQGRSVMVERDVAAALVWDLRGRAVRTFVGLPPEADLIVQATASQPPPGLVPAGPPMAVAVRWYPSGWDTPGVIRWLMYRQGWGTRHALDAQPLRPAS